MSHNLGDEVRSDSKPIFLSCGKEAELWVMLTLHVDVKQR